MKSFVVILFLIIFPCQVFGQNTDSLSADSFLISNPPIIDAPGPYDSDPSDDKPLKTVDVEAQFPGGSTKFSQYVTENFKYPVRCQEEGINGKVRLRFIVGIDGVIENIKVLDSTSACPEFTAEAIRLLKISPRWIPAQSKGRFVKSWRELPIALRVE